MVKQQDTIKKILKEKKQISRLDILVIFILVIVILDLQFLGMFGRTTFPQDCTVIFEGGYRISSGQIPYQDFYIPLGPVVFYMQAFFNSIFGINIASLAIHAFMLAVILSVIFYYIVRKEFGIVMSFIFALFFYLSFSGLKFHPFYNFTPYFFLFLNIFLLYKYRKKETLPWFIYLLSALLGALGFYTKQDVGLLHIVLVFVYFVYNYRKQWKSIIFYYIIPSFIFVVGTYLILSNIPNFTYWFNIGQYPHSSRISRFLDPKRVVNMIVSWKLYVSLAFIFLILFRKIKNTNTKKIISLFLIISITKMISDILSPARQVAVMGVPILIFFAYILAKNHIKPLIKEHKLAINLIIIVLLLLTVSPLPTYGLITLNYLNQDLGRIPEGCYKGHLISKSDIQGLNKIREVIEENENDFISMTEYTFLYCDYNITPPVKLPAWFAGGITFFDENVQDIIQVIKSNNPRVILLQDTHAHEDQSLNKKFEESFISLGYIKKEVIISTKTTEIKPKAPITILIRNDSLSKNKL